ncbi:hypothetical protein I6A60_39380 [Frankia sp. AgB1.9]|nr:hypothetical protein [Frankia sp. AgW1.1]MBL7553847.1 hypothetical protein [Frankia sp. AgB1.9]MBL7618019.1 hypothetical protein [Frankia sp. AgB1.8]
MPVVFGTVNRRPASSGAKIGPVPSGAKNRPVRRGARRAATLAVLTTLTVPLFSAAALADTGQVGTKYNPDPLSPLDTWLIYGGTIVGGFLLALVLTALAGRKSSARYRPGQRWEHDSIWLGGESADQDAADAPKETAGTATPGSGGASGKW